MLPLLLLMMMILENRTFLRREREFIQIIISISFLCIINNTKHRK